MKTPQLSELLDTSIQDQWLNSEEFRNDPDYITDSLSISLMEEVCQLMEKEGITRSDIARRMGVSRERVTQLFNAPNITLRSIVRLAIALRVKITIKLEEET